MQVIFADGWNASVVGEVDADNCDEFAEDLRSGTRTGDTFTINLARLNFIDSSGISALLGVMKDVEAEGGSLILQQPTDSVRRILEITGLLETFGLVD